jgi:hypothetical protein
VKVTEMEKEIGISILNVETAGRADGELDN